MKPTFTQLPQQGYFNGSFLTILLVLLLSLTQAKAGVVVTIPSTPGTDTSSFTPTNRRTTFSAARMLFSSTEIGTTGTITHIGFQKASGSTTTSINYIGIYMRETTASTITTTVPASYTSYATSGYKKVYSGYIDNTMSSGWTTVTLSTAASDIVTYSGGSNYLDVLIVKENTETAVTSYPNYPVFNTHTTSGSVSAYYTGSSLLGTTFTTLTTKRPNVQLTFNNTCAGKPAAGTVSGPPTAVCSGANFTLTGTGITVGTGMHYQWQSRNSGVGAYADMASTDTFTTLTTSTTVAKDYRLVSQCVLSSQSDTSAPITINVVNATTISASSDTTFCIGGSVLLTTPTVSGVTYTWFNGATSTGITGSSYTATTSGIYSVRAATSSCAGLFSNTKTVTVNPLPTATVTPLSATTFCDGLSVVLQANTGTGLSYQWQSSSVDISGATSSTYTATTSGSYRVKVTNTATGCFAYSSATSVTVNPAPVAPVISGAGGKTSYCAADNLVLSTTPTSGISYQWRNSSGIIVGATSSSYTATTPNTYTLIATLGPCSTNSNSLVITENPLPAASITPVGTVSFCNGDSLKIVATASSGVNYEWQESGTAISGAPNSATIFVKTAGVYRVKVTNTTTGCSDISPTLTVNIITIPTPTVSAAGPTTFCDGGSVTLNAVVGTGLTMQWQDGTTDISGATTSSYSTSVGGSFRMKVTNGVGCATYSTPVDVKVNPLPANTLTVTGGTDICNGSTSVILAPSVAKHTYQWRNLSVDIPGETGNPYYAKTAGTYSVHIKDSNGCESTSPDVTITVKFVRPFHIHPYGNTFFCDGESTKLATQSGFTSYQWYLDGVFIPGATDTFVYAKKNGKYTVMVQDPVNSCFATSAGFNILVIPAPDTPFITKVGSRLSTNVKDVRYQWYKNGVAIAGATDSFIYESGSGIYAVEVTNDRECSKRAEIDLTTTSVDQAVSKTYFIKVYPNPTQDKLNVGAPSGVTVSLIDLQGRVLYQQFEAKQIPMAAYAPGIYILQFTDDRNQVIATEKVSKVDY